MALKFDLAIRKYVADHIRPVMYDLVGEEEFILETMSTSYVARSIFEEVRTQFPDYIIKFSSDNPRNPINQAGPEEMEIIQLFNDNPGLTQWEGMITIKDKPYMAKFKARSMAPSCTLCHGNPSDAPHSIIEKYRDKAGFNRPMGKVIGMDTVAIPVTKISRKFWTELGNTFLISLIGLLVFFFAVFIAIKKLIINRLLLISSHFASAVEASDYSKITPIHDKGVILDCNQGLSQLTGYPRDELIGMNGMVLIAPEWRERTMEKVYSGYEHPYEL